MISLKKLSLSLLMIFAAVTYAQAVDVNSETGFTAEMNTENPKINVISTIIFSDNIPFSDNKTVAVNLSTNAVLDGSESYRGFRLTTNSEIALSGNTGSKISNFKTVDIGGALYSYDSLVAVSGNTTFADNSADINGGAVYLDRSTATFSGNTTFSNNTADWGGAVYLSQSSATFSGTTTFSSNTTHYSGGAVALAGSSAAFGGNTTFSSNTANDFGGAVYLERSRATFSGNTTFSSNTATNGTGGALYITASSTTFSGSTTFSNNTATVGGAIWLFDNSHTAFSGTTEFSSNTASSGGAVYLEGSTATFKGSTATFSGSTTFSNNTATAEHSDGGAVYLEYGNSATFDGTTIFLSNRANRFGGAVYLVYSDAKFRDNTTFLGNTASHGGAMFVTDGSTATFSGTTTFSSNTANTSAGAVYVFYSNAKFRDNTTFLGNTATQNGGAVNVRYDSNATFEGTTTFTGNTAGSGGAVSLDDGGSATFGGNTTFSGNIATSSGGAVYLNESTVMFNTDSGKVLFTGNTANGKANDIYMENGAILKLEATNNEIRLEGGIVSVDTSNIINKTGKDTLYLGGINNITGNFNLKEGVMSIIADSTITSLGNFTIGNGSVFESNGVNINASTASINGLWVAKGGEIINAGKVEIGASGDFLLSGKVSTGTTQTYLILQSAGAIDGRFEDKDLVKTQYRYDFGVNSATVTVTGTAANYSDVKGLSENGKEASKVLDKLYDDAYAENGDMWNKIISKTDNMTFKEYQKTAGEIAGGFIANVITAGAENEWKGRAFRELRKEENKENLWINAGAGTKGYKEDDNVNGKFKDNSIGFEAGYGFYNSEKVKAGAAIGYNSHSIDQGRDEATMGEINGGLYAGMFSGKIEWKGALKFGFQSYETTRKVIDETVEGSFSGFGINADIEAGYRIGWKENIDMVPFAGLGLGMVNTGSYEEEGFGGLEVESGSYIRTAATAGVSAEGKTGKMKWYGKAGLKLLLSGATGEIEGSFEGTKIKAVGTEQGTAGIEFGAGAEYAIKEGMSIFADAGMGAGTSSSMSGMLGMKMKVGK